MAPRKKPPHDRSPTFLRDWRKFRELTLEAACERFDIDRTTLGRIEKGQLPYNQDFLEKAALAYGCEPQDLLSINPRAPDAPRLLFSRLLQAPEKVQRQAAEIFETLLKNAS
jgi:transcriptional regulator with XRE-family HTH domain